MVTENVDIRFRESGARVIKRRIDEIGEAANRSTRGIFLMQRAIFVLGGAGAIRALATQADLLTNVENRLRLTTTSTQNLEEVQKRLFQVARDSRSSFESVAEIYNRTALSVRQLGISQKETARFTESLAKASILSGASTREANAALIQLSQGLASNRLSGDELRSVLEQLPFVADVIAKHMGITRGELRQFGRDGKISAQVVLEAFRGASDEIDKLFAETSPTISQALSVANTNWLEFLDNLEDTYGISSKVAKAIIFLSENIELIAGTLGVAAASIAASFGIKAVQSIANFTLGLRAGAVASSRLLEIENLRAAANVRRTQASVAANAQRQVELQQRLSLLGIQKAQLQQTVLDTQYTVANGRARNIATGRYVSLSAAKANLSRVTQQLSIVEGVEATTAARLAGARTAQAAGATTLAGANARLAAAQAASSSMAARLTRQFPLLAGAVGLASRAVMGLWAILVANPIGAIVTAIALIVGAFIRWGNKIKVTQDGVVGLKDAVIAAFQIMMERIAPVANFFRESIGGAISSVTEFFGNLGDDVLRIMKFIAETVYDTFTFFPRIAVATISGIIAAFQSLPDGASSSVATLANIVISGFEALANGAIRALNKVIEALNSLLSFVGADKAAELFGFSGQIGKIGEVELTRFKSEYEGAGKTAATAFGDAFKTSFESTSLEGTVKAVGSALAPIGKEITDRARANIAAAAAEAANTPENTITPTTPGGGGGGGGKSAPDFASKIAEMKQEIELLQLGTRERERANAILQIEKELKRNLTDTERALADQTLRSLEAAKTQADVLESIVGPRREAAENQAALNELFRQGRIDIQDYTAAIREMQIAADEASGTLFGSFRASISSAIMSASDLGTALGDWVVGAADKAADAIVEFAKTGEFNVRKFFNDLFAQLLKLAAKQILLRLLGSILGVPLGGGGGPLGFSGGGSILPAFSSGGSISPTGPGSTDSQIVMFNKRPDERVDILTPGQQKSQRDALNSNNQSPTIVKSEPKIVNVLDPSIVGDYLTTPEGEGVLVNTIRRSGVLER